MNLSSSKSYASFHSTKGSTYGSTLSHYYSFQVSKRSTGLVYRNRDEVFPSQTALFQPWANSIIVVNEVTRSPSIT